jgi:hypothetical protein
MRHRQNPRSFAKPAAMLAIGAALGLFASFQVVALIRDARSMGAFGAAPLPAAVAPQAAKPTAEEQALAHAMAAAIGARTVEDCRSLAPEHRPGCRSYVERLREEGMTAFDPETAAGDGNSMFGAIAPAAPSR